MLRAMDTETDNGFAILITKPFSFAEPTSWNDCIEFLATDREMICWNSDYDIQACLKYLPRMVRDRLSVIGEVRHENYWIKYVPHKFFRVWRSLQHCRETWKLLFSIYDLKQFYNCSLKKAAEKLGVQEKKSIPEAWYKHMLRYLKDSRTRPQVLDYALGDAQTLQAIIDRTVESFALAGLKFERPISNASFAKRYFGQKLRVTRHSDVERMARSAYHGGRIECLRAGTFKIAYHYDIHSAYPSVIADLEKPDGEWYYEKLLDPNSLRSDLKYAFLDCEIQIPDSEKIGSIPYRRMTGSIIYPVGRFRKIITLTEFRYLQERGHVHKIYRAWLHIWTKGNFPFQEIRDIYQRRKADPRIDYAFKIVMNSTYGVLAEMLEMNQLSSIVDGSTQLFDQRAWRKHEHWTNHTSFVYAAEITARIRIRLLRDIPINTVISYSTDGVFTTKPVMIRTGNALGEWADVEKVYDLTVIGSGVYTYRDADGKQHVKFRGFDPQFDLAAILNRANTRHSISIQTLRNTSLRLAYVRKNPREMNVLRQMIRYLDINFDTKRVWPKRWSARELLKQQFESKPYNYYGKVKVPMYE